MAQEETRKEKLARLLAKGKLKRERNEIIEMYTDDLKYPLTMDKFLDLTYSNTIRSSVYRKISTLPEQRFAEYQNALNALKGMKERSSALRERTVIFYYLGLLLQEVGGIVLPLQDVWDILENPYKKKEIDIMIVAIDFSFGISLDVEEYSCSVTSWGL